MTNSKPPIWRDYRFLQIATQVIAVILAIAIVTI
ncbi:MAG: amino acid ABC transporter permease, partial [Sphaerospermopsis sp.]|nr:amino acid ABC transporter permease [Sphaerospermopsis sp.]